MPSMRVWVSVSMLFAVVTCGPRGLWADEDDQPVETGASPPVVHGSLEVTATAIPIPSVSVVEREAVRATIPIGDGSEVLRGIAGADLGRMGGHGLEPFIRGMSRGDLTVLLDGATVNGGCPNRMDPATAYVSAETTDRVVVVRGVQTLRYGPGAPGGTVLYDRRLPGPDAGPWSVDLAAGTTSWSAAPDLAVDVALGLGEWGLRATGSFRDLDNYSDGNGNEVRSAARSTSAMMMGGWRRQDTMVELSYEWADTTDALFAGAGMDAPESTAQIFRLQTERQAARGRVGWHAHAFYDTVDHLMDNYSLRPFRAPMALEVPTETATAGLRGHLELRGRLPLFVGVTLERADADATRLGGPNPDSISMVQSVMWPEVSRQQLGLFAEGIGRLGAGTRLVYGFRVDHFSADAGRADEATMGGNGPTPRQLWTRYYGESEVAWADTDFGGLLRLEYVRGPWSLQAGVSRTIRVADATERYLGANSAIASLRWVGSPALQPARFHQLDVGAGWSSGGSRADAALFAADVDGYLLADRAHGQPGIAQTDGARIYRNVSALRYGAELDGVFHTGSPVVLSGGLWWVWAENTTDDRPIAQTPPLTGQITTTWQESRWSLGGTIRFAAEQNRVDDDPSTGSGLDAGPTPGWAVLDAAAEVRLGAGLSLTAGVANIFDLNYANHLNRGSLFDPNPVRVNEPGRTLWLRLRWRAAG